MYKSADPRRPKWKPGRSSSRSVYNGLMRSEQEIFDDLAVLCSPQGFIHAVAFICFRDTIVSYSDELKAEDMAQLFLKSRLLRTEVTTLTGLMMRSPIDFILPTPEAISGYIEHIDRQIGGRRCWQATETALVQAGS